MDGADHGFHALAKAGEAATLADTMPVWTALLAWPVLGERLSAPG